MNRVVLASVPLVFFGWLCASTLLSAPRAHQDVGMYLQAGALLLDGKRPYVDFVDINPPMVIYLNTVPVALARWSGMHSMRALAILLALVAGWSARSCWSSLRRARSREAEIAASLIAIVILGFSVWLFGESDYGQREHVLLLLYLPYLCARAGVDDSHRRGLLAFLRGVAAGVGICAKPQYALLAAASELYLLVSRRDWRVVAAADTIGLGTALLAYAAHFALLPSDIRDAFFYRWVPFIARGYFAYDNPLDTWHANFKLVAVLAAIALTAIFALARLRWFGSLADLSAVLGVDVTAAVTIIVLQGKWWFYHFIPVFGFLAAAVSCIVAAAVQRVEARTGARASWGTAAALAMACALFAGSLAFYGEPFRLAYPPPKDALREFVERYTRPGDRVLVCSTFPAPAYPLLTEQDRLPGSRFLFLFPLGMLSKVQHQPEHAAWAAAEEQRILRELKQDIEQAPPSLVITRVPEADENLTEYLRQRGVFDSLSELRRVGEANGYWVYARPSAN